MEPDEITVEQETMMELPVGDAKEYYIENRQMDCLKIPEIDECLYFGESGVLKKTDTGWQLMLLTKRYDRRIDETANKN